jgi:hypothetical protein
MNRSLEAGDALMIKIKGDFILYYARLALSLEMKFE